MEITLVSYILCPYAQRASISLMEKGVDFTRINIDLSDKPDWFNEISPLGKVPLLRVTSKDQEAVVFESSVILEYLEEAQANPLHPTNPLQRAMERSWMEFGSTILNDIAGFYSAKTDEILKTKIHVLKDKFERLDLALSDGPWFAGERFGLVDAVFGPIFRYFDVFDSFEDFGILKGRHKIHAWRVRLGHRPSVQKAVPLDYPALLSRFLMNKKSALSARMTK